MVTIHIPLLCLYLYQEEGKAEFLIKQTTQITFKKKKKEREHLLLKTLAILKIQDLGKCSNKIIYLPISLINHTFVSARIYLINTD